MLLSKQGVLLFTWLFTLLAPVQPTSAGAMHGIPGQHVTPSYETHAAAQPAAASPYTGTLNRYQSMNAYPYASSFYEYGVTGTSPSAPYGASQPNPSATAANPYGGFNLSTVRALIPGYLVDRYLERAYPGTAGSERSGSARFVQTAGGLVSKISSERGEVGLSAPKSQTRYVVRKGDTLYRIARMFDTSIDLLIAENRISDPTKLQVGQRLSIPLVGADMPTWLASSSEISDVFYATLTAYTAGYESTGKTPSHPAYGITASGARVKENFTIAVDPEVIPLGSLVYIEGLGIRKAEDTGSAIKGKKIDVYIPDLEEALEFGVKKNVKVYVLKKGSDKQDVSIASANGS
jgi:3D (Asp-Asp-Asp) domain-containing protein